MVSLVALWLPILLSAVFVFIVSSLIHMVLGYHANDYRRLPNEDGTMDALRRMNIPPGQYHMPHASSMKEMKSSEFREKVRKGPGAMLTIWPGGDNAILGFLAQWFLYTMVVGLFAAYVAGRALPPGMDFLWVFRFAGATSFACYAIGGWQESIWFKRSWKVTLKNTFDGLLYALITGGTFGWLWPR